MPLNLSNKLVDKRQACLCARRAKKDIQIGVCGEQAGEPRSVEYLHGIGVDYVSCSPFRIPIARLVAAQTALKAKGTVSDFECGA